MMNDILVPLIVVVALIGGLVGVAYLLQQRSKRKGDLLTGTKSSMLPQARGRFYLSLLVTLVGAVLGTWGILRPSFPLIVIGGLLIVGSIGVRYFWQLTHLIKKDDEDESPGTSG
jgi:hypothetical protein